MKYFVSRQCYWPDGDLFVEIASGGLDYANPGMLGVRFKSLGEGQEYTDPREAVEAAIKIRDAWNAGADESQIINLGYGSTGGMTMPFDSCTDEDAIAWAEKRYESLPKCDQCGELLGKEVFTNDMDEKFCRQYCAEKNYDANRPDYGEDSDEGGEG